MQKHWLKRIGAPDLIVVALGWASEPRLVQNIPTEEHDVLVLYDYRTPVTVIKANLIPSFLFTTRIIIFSSIYAIEGYRTKIIFPIIIGMNRRTCSIFVVNNQLK